MYQILNDWFDLCARVPSGLGAAFFKGHKCPAGVRRDGDNLSLFKGASPLVFTAQCVYK